MKRFVIILALALISVAASAQYVGGAKYKDIKNNYNPKQYMPSTMDPYSPTWSSFFSFFVPGSSQMLSGEVLRGALFLAGAGLTSSMISDTYSDLMEKRLTTNADQTQLVWVDKAGGQLDVWIIAGCLAVDLGISIWSSIDANKIAKVKNMYYQDMMGRRSSVEMNFAPSLAFTPSTAGNAQPAPGLAFTLAF